MDTEQKANRPVHEVRFGVARAAIWKNASGFHTVSVSRLYKNAEGKWSDSSSFDRDDIPQLLKALDAAYCWIHTSKD
jgi:hypothetical protein